MNIQNQPKGSRERTLDEVKAEFMRRAGKLNPFEDIKREDAETVMAALKNLDKDHWAEEWSKIGLGYEAKGDAAAKAGASGKELAEIYMHAFDACRVGRYPSPTSPGKLAGLSSIRFACSARRRSISIRRSRSSKCRSRARSSSAICRSRRASTKPPVVMHWGGVDGWKEDRLKIAKTAMDAGLASLTIDMPGSGENPVLYGDPAAERTYSRLARLPADAQRRRRQARRGLGRQLRRLLGGAARLHRRRPHQGRGVPRRQRALRLPARMAGAGVHHRRRDLSVRRGEPARRARPRDGREDDRGISGRPCAPLSLKTMGLLDKKSAPLLGVNGKLDDQAPIADVYLLMEHGNPKSARVYPEGHHMGRTPGQHPDEIANTIVGWLKERLGA